MTDDQNRTSLSENDDLWGQLLGRKLDRISEEERNSGNLIEKFCENKEDLVRFYHGSIEGLKEEVRNSSDEEAEEILYYLWAEYEWRNKSTGTKFTIQNRLKEELDQLEDAGNIVRRLSEDFALVWSGEEHRRNLKQSEKIRSEVQTEAKPVFIRSKDDEQIVEVRGPNRLLDNFSNEFTESEDVEEVTPEPTDESVLEELSSAFSTELSSLDLVEVKFNSTNLPNGSSLTVGNTEGVKGDLNDSSLLSEYVDTNNLTDLDYLKFHHKKDGVKVKVKLERNDKGVYFEVDDSNLSEDEKKNVREILENKIGISCNTLYPYDAQHNREYIINQILTGNVEVYRKYYDLLDKEAQEFIEKFVNAVGQDTLYCYECHRGFYEFHIDEKHCPDCGLSLMRGEPSLKVEVDDGLIKESVGEKLLEFDEDIKGPNGTRLIQLDFESVEIASNDFIKTDFHLAESAGTAMDSHWYEYFTYSLGNGDIPQRVGEYLLDCVLITYGNSELRGREDFGTVSLYKLLREDNPESQFVEAVRESQSRLRNRVREKANEAKHRLRELQEKVDDGTIADASHDERNELKAEYDFDDFERDIFYLFKSMFLFTERWGREGKKETDGCLIIPDGENGYFVASYDPKLTYDNKGYDLGADEKNKAAYYVLSESDHEYISEVLKDGGSIDAHIFVSDIFREGQFDHVAETVNDWFSLTQNAEGMDVPVIFLSLDSLLSLYRIFDSNYNFIMEYPSVQKSFRQEIQNQFRISNRYQVIDEESVEKVEEKVLEARASARRKKAAKTYTDT